MKYTYVLLAAAGLAAAQKKFTDVIPECSVECLTKAVKDGTTCSSIDDSQCICEATNYRNIYTVGVSCVLAACNPDVATGQLLPAAAAFCREVTGGATAPPASAASSSASAASSSASAAVSSPASSAAASASASATAASGSDSASVTGTPTAAASGTGAPATETTAQPGGAASMGSMGAAGMLALGALAIF